MFTIYRENMGLKDKALSILIVSLRFLPRWIDAISAGAFMSALIDKNPGLKDKLKGLDGKVFLFDALDIKRHFFMIVRHNGISILPNYAGNADVTMKGTTKILFGLLTGSVDPDTVFFSRRLEIGGDTAAAIHFKNILNSL